ncbi:MAG: hypothetical protein ACRDEA_05315, partial [Microcystaceae cyanobacterium]
MPLPESAQVHVPPKLATDLLRAAKKLPSYDDDALYDVNLQAAVREQIRTSTGDGFDWLVEEIRSRLSQRPYFAYVTGLQFDDSNLVLVSLAGAFGDAVDLYNQSESRIVRHVVPSKDVVVPDWGVITTVLHTDSPGWPQPNAITGLVCVRPDQNGGGCSRLLDIDTLRVELDRRFGQEVLGILHTEPVPWSIDDELGGGVIRTPVFTANRVRWLGYMINRALEKTQETLPEPVSASLEAMEQFLKEPRGVIEFLMAP